MPLARRTDLGDSAYAGLEVDVCGDLQRCLADTLAGGLDFLVAPLAHPRHRRPSAAAASRDPSAPAPAPFARSDLLLNSAQWSSQVVGKTSPWIDADSPSAPYRADSEAALRQELGWAAHLSLHAVLLPPPRLGAANYARIVCQFLGALSHTALWVRVPLVDPASLASAVDACTRRRIHDPFEAWAFLRAACEGHPQLGVCLHVGASLPSDGELARWIGEPVRAIVVAEDAFTTNKRGFPVLPKRHQEFLTSMLRRNVQVPTPAEAAAQAAASTGSRDGWHSTRRRWEYLVYLFRKIPDATEQELVEAGYRDYLQAPLQPLMDNLESATYETFEKDASKYTCYEEAVLACLRDRVTDADAAAGKETVLMVVGAGRGPLVRASLRASERCGRKLRVYAVEKNPNAVITLQSLVAAEGWTNVSVMSSDMRAADPPEKADVLVSELLGSFGDNELSPECLDGAQRFLKDDGVSIPQAYTSYLAPVTCAKLWNDAKAYGDLAHMETPYVVKLHRCSLIADPAEVFTFEHPNHADVVDNSRYAKLRWRREPRSHAATMHGFAGYFDAKLYEGPAGNVHCSIYPPTHTMGPTGEPMFSWFPIYFPLRYPVHVPAGCDVEAHMWRCIGPSKVWYEWSVTAPDVGPIHNVNGRSYWVGL
ncbi:protein arginine methyltransferase [Micromonas commoda]|uniref:Protein arginine N-methyltransferase n=1 Tax=Micromonas commoda (strain RCC299 / NOUM17 / CCMP2709) TaxID=296587 RepID=C1FH87_MICCC|nr:protein arginine methyltransferase [Micromonas commoda]ACO69780.1 protein arginine methyltransferase [Micromonas commoda]|eukprot:XP_002508522.1 protein arginine methyltransferase [Micromonas commoda]